MYCLEVYIVLSTLILTLAGCSNLQPQAVAAQANTIPESYARITTHATYPNDLRGQAAIHGFVRGAEYYTLDSLYALPGATIVIADEPIGVQTDHLGRYEISGLTPGRYTVRASFIGIGSHEIGLALKANEVAVVDFTLYPEMKPIESGVNVHME